MKNKSKSLLPSSLAFLASSVALAMLLGIPFRDSFEGNSKNTVSTVRILGGREAGELERYAKTKGRLAAKIVQRESGYRNIPCNYSPKCTEWGVAQFKRPTFDLYCQGDYYNAYDQIDCLKKMLDRGLCYHWT